MSMRQKNSLQKGKSLVVDVEAHKSFSANRWPEELGDHGVRSEIGSKSRLPRMV